MTTPAGASSGNGYWRGQIGATALFGVGPVSSRRSSRCSAPS
ncbi:hypothetical protein [Curtobacterium flaccumfaciens]|nr:hypothetical protein [Curtobacterium flaccumfaciens]MCS5468660.1 hypothetical protein [Curtobacterium flaccumfaciens pv. betae]MCS5514364.1 hypothetical protein [Curtobacterium flaccumfaciens pv. betae]MCX2871654.1 hypothetical protein [Curtobacterium flaccumfaciens pv. betae]UWD87541.1 hypothetical protein NY059_07560 [Curtobacterium flaccumfaciens pv. betae]UWT73487.1 hypothetical protein N3C65_11740 [Curtobacterium flaccumfaciens pv. betae]